VMQTLTFIGSDKNAGKTTVFNYIYNQMRLKSGNDKICLASTGINGETVDNLEGHPKPAIIVQGGSYFVTTEINLEKHRDKYIHQKILKFPFSSEMYTLGKALKEFPIILEGPNSRDGLIRMKTVLEVCIPHGTLLIDGSVDREFLAHPAVSDGFYYSALISKREVQLSNVRRMLMSFAFPVCSEKLQSVIGTYNNGRTKTLLFDINHTLQYHGRQIPFLDHDLLQNCNRLENHTGFLYLNGAFTASLNKILVFFENLTIILDNFTLYRCQAFQKQKVNLLHSVGLCGIFIRRETGKEIDNMLSWPDEVCITDLSEIIDNNQSVVSRNWIKGGET